jgi:predicted amidohydrolase YtcJ
MLDRDLDWLLELDVDQVSFYPLMTAPTARHKMRKSMGEADVKGSIEPGKYADMTRLCKFSDHLCRRSDDPKYPVFRCPNWEIELLDVT